MCLKHRHTQTHTLCNISVVYNCFWTSKARTLTVPSEGESENKSMVGRQSALPLEILEGGGGGGVEGIPKTTEYDVIIFTVAQLVLSSITLSILRSR